jgi:FkbM family methyltransferase
MTWKHAARTLVRRIGWDVERYPSSDPLFRVVQIMHHRRVETVLDIGANVGAFGIALRNHGYEGRIISFEPLSVPFRRLARVVATDEHWLAVPAAVGASPGRATVNIAGNSAASSSILPMLERHRRAAPESAYVGTERVDVVSVDEYLDSEGGINGDVFLKIDVQGFESAVLKGAERAFSSGAVVGGQIEVSFVQLYEGAASWLEVLDHWRSRGFTVAAVNPGFADPSTFEILQADVVFVREVNF